MIFFSQTTASASYVREGVLSKMVTTVDPCNPFNQINKEPIIVK